MKKIRRQSPASQPSSLTIQTFNPEEATILSAMEYFTSSPNVVNDDENDIEEMEAAEKQISAQRELALAYLQKNEETVCIVSGGQGKGEAVSEAKAMADYLTGCGIAEERILLENQSTSTFENLQNSYDLIELEETDRIGIVTNNFHMYRAMKYAKRIGFRKVYALVASCDVVLLLNYMTREFFAILAMFSKIKKNK